jgi:hypothetical protein
VFAIFWRVYQSEIKMIFSTKPASMAAAFALSASLTVSSAGMAAAKPVVLVTHDGYSRVSGELLEFKDGVYHIRTALCDLEVKAATVACEGSGCPTQETASQE